MESEMSAGEHPFIKPIKNAYRIEEFFGNELLYMLILSALIGLGGGFGAIVFIKMINGITSLFFFKGNTLDILGSLPWYYKLVPPVIGGLLVGPIVNRFAREAKGHGVPEVMHAVSSLGGRMRPRVVAVKALVSSITIGSGGSVGREGPIIQIGSSFGSAVGQLLGFEKDKLKTLLACGASAGIAATFNAPIAGVLFSVEIILGAATITNFSALVVSSVTATALSRQFLGNQPAFILPAYEMASLWEYIFYIALGIAAGATAVAFTKSLYKLEDLWEKIPGGVLLQGALGGLLLGGTAIFAPHILGNGYETVEKILHGEITLVFLLLLILLKLYATSISLASGGSGGVFAPSLFVGAALGGAFGVIASQLFPGLIAPAGAYAIIGMAAVVAGTTHASLTAIIMLFEMTDEYTIILPLMLACIASVVVSSRISGASIYTTKLLRRGDLVPGAGESAILHQKKVKEILRFDAPIVKHDVHYRKVLDAVFSNPHFHAYVVDEEGRLEGRITLELIKAALTQTDLLDDIIIAEDVMIPVEYSVHISDTLADCMQIFGRSGLLDLPVVDDEHQVIGRICHDDLISLYSREVFQFGAFGPGFSVTAGKETSSRKNVKLALAEGQVAEAVVVRGKLAGMSLRELDLRHRFGVEVVGVRHAKSATGGVRIAPNPEEPLTEKDILVIVGTYDQIKRVKELELP